MNQFYPPKHHPIFFLQDALKVEGVVASFHRDEKSKGLWGLDVNGRMCVWLIDIRWPHEKAAHESNIRALQEEGALVMCAQKPDAEYFDCEWFPLAASPEYYAPKKRPAPLTDLAMVGYVRDKGREQLLLDLNNQFTISIAQGVFGNEAVETYHQAKLGINIPTRYQDLNAYDSANMRCFEILATGTVLITSYEDYLVELGLIAGVNCFTYTSPQDCIAVVRQALDRDNLDTIGKNAVDLISDNHTYQHRAKQVLEWLS